MVNFTQTIFEISTFFPDIFVLCCRSLNFDDLSFNLSVDVLGKCLNTTQLSVSQYQTILSVSLLILDHLELNHSSQRPAPTATTSAAASHLTRVSRLTTAVTSAAPRLGVSATQPATAASTMDSRRAALLAFSQDLLGRIRGIFTTYNEEIFMALSSEELRV